MKKHIIHFTLALFLLSGSFSESFAQQKAYVKGTVIRIKVHGKLLEGNLSGDSPDRYVSIYLPAGYKTHPKRRYPVVYFLHGYTDDDAKFYGFEKHWMSLPPILDTVFALDPKHEMIMVTPDAYTRFEGSMYSNSVTTGDWEDFVAKELVAYIDNHYRTISKKGSRGLCGHSMGGYGAMRIGEKNPDVFSAVYLLSPCCLVSSPMPTTAIPKGYLHADSIKTIEELQKGGFMAEALFASAAAWSPDPANPPFYVDLPVKNGKLQPQILQKWGANRPLNSLDQYIYNIKKLTAIGFDAGNKDTGIAASLRLLNTELNEYNIKHSFEIYDGTHTSHVADRVKNKMLEFFQKNLTFQQKLKK